MLKEKINILLKLNKIKIKKCLEILILIIKMHFLLFAN